MRYSKHVPLVYKIYILYRYRNIIPSPLVLTKIFRPKRNFGEYTAGIPHTHHIPWYTGINV